MTSKAAVNVLEFENAGQAFAFALKTITVGKRRAKLYKEAGVWHVAVK